MIGRLQCSVIALSLALGMSASLALTTTASFAAGQRPAKSKSVAKPELDAMPSSEAADPLTPAESNTGPLQAPGATAAQAAAQPATEADPIVAEVRKRLAEQRADPRGSNTAADRTGLAAFYAQGNGQPVWTTKDGLTPRATAAISEIRNADDWGLDAKAFELPTLAAGDATTEALADAEIKLGLAVLKYARHARGGRLDPQSLSKLFDHKPRLYEPKSVLQGISGTQAADVYLRGLHPKHPQFERLRQALIAARGKPVVASEEKQSDVKIPAGPKVKPGEKHAQVALIRQRLAVTAETGKDTVYDDLLVKAVMAYQGEHGIEPNGIITNDTRTALNGTARRTPAENTQRLLVNMERWRWMPDNLGAFHVWDSIPEQMTRVVNDGKVVFTEKIVVGKVTTPTPLFTANMQFVVFHPEWGVPDGIKTNELAPLLRRANPNGDNWFFGGGGRTPASVLKAVGGLRPSINGHPVDPDKVNWSSIDIRQVQFVQPAGGPNVLGVVKFRFPNKHDVYMHDTPERHLFNGSVRAFSHGCMRVQNPVRLAEVLLEHDKGWASDKVQGYLRQGGTSDIKLSKEIPVHVTYFTANVDDAGKLHTYADLYGLDNRVASALAGRQVQLIAERSPDTEKTTDPSVKAERQLKPRPRIASRAQTVASGGNTNPFAGLFGN